MAGWKYRYNLDSKEWKYDYWFIFYIYIGFNLGELQKAISEDTGININNLDKSDILEITLTPRKISRDNGGKYPYHIDCALSIKSRSAFTAKFWVKNPNDTEYTQVDAKTIKLEILLLKQSKVRMRKLSME